MNISRRQSTKIIKISSNEKKTIDVAAKKIVKNYGKTLQLLAKE